jgi:hypothetical protein
MINNDKSIQLYQAVLDGNEERIFKAWHASSLAMCPRAHFFKRKGVEGLRKPSGAKVIRWNAGHHLETAIRPIIEAVYGETGSNERMYSKRLDLTGEFDNLVVSNNKLVEIKSVHDFAFKEKDGVLGLKKQVGTYPNGNKKWDISPDPYLGHEIQNHAYVELLKDMGVEVSGIDYVYISLSGRLVVYSTEVQEKITKNVLNRLEVLNKAWETDTPPECICVDTHPLWESTMQWCDYQQRDDSDKIVSCCSVKLLKEAK